MGAQPYWAFYVGDWLKDANVGLCSPEARGVWLDFLCAMHELRSGGVLTGDKEQLCRIGRCSHAQLDRALNELQTSRTAEISSRDGIFTIVCRRMRKEAEIAATRAKSGSKSYSKRLANSDIEIEDEIRGCEWWKDLDFQKAWSEWEQHRESIKKPLTTIAKLKQIQELKRIGKARALAAINISILRQWQGIYEPKEQVFGVAPTNGANTVVLHEEYKRVCDRMKTLRDTYSGHQTWAKDDIAEYNQRLKPRKLELMKILNIQV